MIPSDNSFDKNSSYEDNGRTIFRWHHVHRKGGYQLYFRIVSTNSVHRQGIALFFSDFKGKVLLNGMQLKIPKGVFGHYVFKEGEFPNNEFVLSVHAEEGHVFFGNASEREEIGLFTCGAFSNAFWLEQIDCTAFRFHCNDHEYDEDFDDMIFEMSVLD